MTDISNSEIPGITAPEPAMVNVGNIDRRTYIGGSRVSAILGLDPYGKTPLTEWEKIVGEIQTGQLDPETLAFFEWRKEWEPIVIKRAIREFKANVIAQNNRYVDKEFDFFAAEIDFEWADENGEIQNAEIKTVHPIAFSEKHGWGEEGTDQVPIHYAAQCMWGLGVTGRQTCILVALAGIDKFVFYRIDRDEELIAEMRETCRRFWVENVLAKVAPDPINWADMSRVAPKLKGRPVELDEMHLKILQDIDAARAMEKSSKEAVEELSFQLAMFIRGAWNQSVETDDGVGENAELRFNGKKVGTWNKQPHSSLDQKRLGIEKPEIKIEYTKTKTIRVIRLAKAKS